MGVRRLYFEFRGFLLKQTRPRQKERRTDA
jgi:hypothetical protein